MKRLSPHLSRQQGSVLVNVAAGLFLMITLLASIDLGMLYYYKREYQKAADIAAIAGARQLPVSCAAAEAAGIDSANTNLARHTHDNPTAQCGVWDPSSTPRFTVGTSNANAVRALVLGSIPTLFLGSRNLSAEAVAVAGDPFAAFSVGTRTLRADGGLLGEVLAIPGLNIGGTTLLSYDGIADVMVTPGGLLQQLGIPVAADLDIGDFNALLAANSVTLGDLLDATVIAAGQNSLLAANTALLNAVELAVGASDLLVTLGSENGGGGLFAEIVAPGQASARSALDVGVSALGIISTAIGVATANRAIDISGLSLLGNTVTARVGVVEPPSIAIGSLGQNGICDPDEICPTAYTAQTRVFLHVDTGNLPLLGGLLSNTGLLRVNLPIVLDLASGKGTLEKLCTADLKDNGHDRAEVDVQAEILKVCVGNVNQGTLFSTSQSCDGLTQSMQLVNVLGLLTVNNKLEINGLQANDTVTLREGETETVSANLNGVGDLVSDLVSQLTGLLLGGTPPSGAPSTQNLNALANQLWNDTASVCTASTPACRGQRLNAAKAKIEQGAQQSGLLTGLLSGIGGLLTTVANDCTGLLYLGGSTSGCISMIQSTLASSSNTSGGGNTSNALSVLVGLLKPVLNALGPVLENLLENVLGLHLGETDVNMLRVKCGGTPQLVE